MSFKIQMEKTNISKSTIATYNSSYKKMLRDLNIAVDKLFTVDNIQLLFYHIKQFKSIGTQMSKLCMMIKYCELNKKSEIVKLLKNKFKELRKIKDNYYGKITENKKKDWVSWIKLKDILNESKSIYNSYNWDFWKGKRNYRMPLKQACRETMVLSLYLESELNPPRRIKDYSRMRVAPLGVKSNDLDPRFNWCCIGEKKFIFNDYKTSRKYKTQIIPINDETMKYIQTYLDVWKVDSYFFKSSKNPDEPMSDAYLSQLIGNSILKYGGKKIGASMLRNIFASNLLKDCPKKNYIKDIAYRMGTSRDMLMDIYRQDVDISGELKD